MFIYQRSKQGKHAKQKSDTTESKAKAKRRSRAKVARKSRKKNRKG